MESCLPHVSCETGWFPVLDRDRNGTKGTVLEERVNWVPRGRVSRPPTVGSPVSGVVTTESSKS